MDIYFLLKNLNKLDEIHQFFLNFSALKTNQNHLAVINTTKALKSSLTCLALEIQQKLNNDSSANNFFDEFKKCENFFNESLKEEITNKDLLLSGFNHVKDFANQYRNLDNIYITNNSDLQALKEKILLIISEKFG